ncbi:MAG: membrane protein [Rhodothermaceae bacterium]|nr:MAG: membrane protein [Rhodothermaceae bacterium]
MANTVRRSSPLTWLVDPLQPTDAEKAFRFSGDARWWMVPTLIGAALLVVSLVGWAVDAHQFYFSYLVGWTFCVSVALGALFFVVIQHLTKARWSVVVRRIPEALVWAFPILALLSVPILIGMHDLYHWTHHELIDPESPEYDPVLAGKAPYLNVPFFIVRLVFYFAVWTLVAYRLYTLSVRQDVTGDPEIPARQRSTSAWGLALMAVTTAFASYDLLMSLDPHWFSTIFGVYFFGGSFWAAFAFITLTAILFQKGGMLRHTITGEHYHDLGKFLFGFTVFWAYIAFSQYMLIWYGNLPEETVWYRHRLEHGWEVHSAALLIGHFIIPFWVLIAKGAKRIPALMAVMSVWALTMHWFDFHWIAMPVLHPEHAGFHWLDFTCWLGLFGLTMGLCYYRLSRHSLVPQRDPYLQKSIHFVNA